MKEKLKNILLKVSKSPLVDEGELLQAYRLVINSLQEALNIKRAGIWFVEQNYSSISCQLLIDTYHNTEIEEFVIDSDDYPHYFTALKAERAILAHDAHTNTATHEFIDRYLEPLNISSMLDEPIKHKGKMIAIVCCEHIGEKSCSEHSVIRNISRSTLDEDTVIFGWVLDANRDELYARVELIPYEPQQSTGNSNMVYGQFGAGESD